MKRNLNIDIHHLTRVEGHGNISIQIKDGKLIDAQWAVVETPRFFEAMLKGMSHHMAPSLTARICGICSIGHSLASLRAVERAMKIRVPKTAQLVRLLAKHGETLQSHLLHLFFLAAPDFFKAGSVIPLIESHPDITGIALRLKEMANTLCDVTAGRTTHPVSLVVGGISKVPSKQRLEELKRSIEERLPDLTAALELFKTIDMPDFKRSTEFVSLKGTNGYPWIGGELISSDGVSKKENEYLSMTNEYVVDFSTSKFAKLSRESFAVGALARCNNNFKFLRPEAQQAARDLGLQPVNCNPFMNNIAQLVECYHVMLESRDIIDTLLDSRLTNIRRAYDISAGRGIGAVEVPRGILYHDYAIDEQGLITKANCIIPTTQNNANIHHDLSELARQLLQQKKSDQEITLLCEMLVRAYDPCISCSVH